jgi:hypothetical protein
MLIQSRHSIWKDSTLTIKKNILNLNLKFNINKKN